MGARIALLIGVANYHNQAPLSACVNHLAIVSGLINCMGDFDDVLVIGDGPSSDVVKEKIAALIRGCQGKDVEELLFRYTGHRAREPLDSQPEQKAPSRTLFATHCLNADRVLISLNSPFCRLNLAPEGWCLPQMGIPLPQSCAA